MTGLILLFICAEPLLFNFLSHNLAIPLILYSILAFLLIISYALMLALIRKKRDREKGPTLRKTVMLRRV
jgi:uncharacterized integral membrane protein